jgi:hypothetical protein
MMAMVIRNNNEWRILFMPLINCSGCGMAISSNSNFCGGCGEKVVDIVTGTNEPEFSISTRLKIIISRNKILAISIITLLVVPTMIILFSTGTVGLTSDERFAIKSVQTLQNELPNAINIVRIKRIYINQDYDDSKAALVNFTAESWILGRYDEWAFISSGDVQFNLDYEIAVSKDDSRGILRNSSVAFARFAVVTRGGNSDWITVDVDRVEKRIK